MTRRKCHGFAFVALKNEARLKKWQKRKKQKEKEEEKKNTLGPVNSSLSHRHPQHCCSLLTEEGSNQFADATFAALLFCVAPAAVR